jgi:hypothetical protein
MSTALLRLPRCAGCDGRRIALRFNRALGWALLVSPAVQWVADVRFVSGLVFDLALLAVHGVLSIVLFGIPAAAPQERWKLWVGLRPAGLSPRNEFLLTGWRLALLVPYTVAGALPVLNWAALIPALWLSIRVPFTLFSHVAQAVGYAARRQGVRDAEDALALGIWTGVAFYVCWLINLFA